MEREFNHRPFDFLKREATDPVAEGLYREGMRWYDGHVSETKAFELFKRACALGHAEACFELRHAFGGVSRENSTPRVLRGILEHAANLGSANAMTMLGVYYAVGGVIGRKNIVKSYEWYYKAAVRGQVDAQYEVGLMRCIGEGCQRSVRTGLRWLFKAADHGHGEARKTLVCAFSEGAWGRRANRRRADELAARWRLKAWNRVRRS